MTQTLARPTLASQLLFSVPKAYRQPPYYCEFAARLYGWTGQGYTESWVRSYDAEEAGREMAEVLAKKKRFSRAFILVYRQTGPGMAELVGQRDLDVARINAVKVDAYSG